MAHSQSLDWSEVVDQQPDLPPEWDAVLTEIARQPENVRAMWRYALVLMMIDDEKARIVATQRDGETFYVLVQTRDGERFSVVRPPMSEEVEQLLLEQIREIATEAQG
jgi:hypothetical protein